MGGVPEWVPDPSSWKGCVASNSITSVLAGASPPPLPLPVPLLLPTAAADSCSWLLMAAAVV